MSNEIVIKLTPVQHQILKAISELILKREEENNVNKKTSINAHSVSKIVGCKFETAKKHLKKLKDL